jgi:hypothetical protein
MVVILLTLVVLFARHARWSEGAVVTVFRVTAYSYPVTGAAAVPATAVQLRVVMLAFPAVAVTDVGAAGMPSGIASVKAIAPLCVSFTARTHTQ